MRADRLLSLALLLQARGVATARSLAAELGVSVRTVYRDLEALSAAGVPGPPGQDGWRVLTLSFEHERAAVHRLAGFGDQVEVLEPPSVRAALLATAREILGRYEAGG